MKTVSIMQAQHNLSKVLRDLQPGDRVAITRHKKIVAEVTTPLQPQIVVFPDFRKRAEATWGQTWEGSTTDDLIRETRGEG